MDANNRHTVAVCQVCSTSNIEENYLNCARAIEAASKSNAKFVCLPECFSFMGEEKGDSLKIAQPLDGPIMTKYRNLAKQYGINFQYLTSQINNYVLDVWLSCGGFHESIPNDNRVYNSHVIIDNHGDIKSVYRKARIIVISHSI
jgi:predicted amidohydrolase